MLHKYLYIEELRYVARSRIIVHSSLVFREDHVCFSSSEFDHCRLVSFSSVPFDLDLSIVKEVIGVGKDMRIVSCTSTAGQP